MYFLSSNKENTILLAFIISDFILKSTIPLKFNMIYQYLLETNCLFYTKSQYYLVIEERRSDHSGRQEYCIILLSMSLPNMSPPNGVIKLGKDTL